MRLREHFFNALLEIAENRSAKDAFAAWISQNVRTRPSMELRDFLRRLDYSRLAITFDGVAAGSIEERVQSIMEAGDVVPAMHQANVGAVAAEHGGDVQSATILRQHAMLLTAIYRIAEDMGYEW
ncbi:MAG: hypothetical protein KF838_07825 [Phycisphaeraceae bacterium]|nr:MAG: hypothetical protein KF838_07825 [Phycisphaeraceae bacterium]